MGIIMGTTNTVISNRSMSVQTMGIDLTRVTLPIFHVFIVLETKKIELLLSANLSNDA